MSKPRHARRGRGERSGALSDLQERSRERTPEENAEGAAFIEKLKEQGRRRQRHPEIASVPYVRTVKPLEARSPNQQKALSEAINAFQRWRVKGGEDLNCADPWLCRAPHIDTLRTYMVHISQCRKSWTDHSKAALKLYLEKIGRRDLMPLVVIPNRTTAGRKRAWAVNHYFKAAFPDAA